MVSVVVMSDWRPYDPCNDNLPSRPEDDPIAEAHRRAREELSEELRARHERIRENVRQSIDNAIRAREESEARLGRNQDYAKQRLESTQKKTCKLHRDCREVDEMVRSAGGRVLRMTNGDEVIVLSAHHEK